MVSCSFCVGINFYHSEKAFPISTVAVAAGIVGLIGAFKIARLVETKGIEMLKPVNKITEQHFQSFALSISYRLLFLFFI